MFIPIHDINTKMSYRINPHFLASYAERPGIQSGTTFVEIRLSGSPPFEITIRDQDWKDFLTALQR
jgi:hypothetical protein